MLRHLIRFAPSNLLLAWAPTGRSTSAPTHPWPTPSVSSPPGDGATTLSHIKGLDALELAELLSALADHEVSRRRSVAAWVHQTDGNLFFIRELARHLFEEGSPVPGAGRPLDHHQPLRELALPDTVREVVARRLSRLSKTANSSFQAASSL